MFASTMLIFSCASNFSCSASRRSCFAKCSIWKAISRLCSSRGTGGSYILRVNQVLFLDIISTVVLLKMVDSVTRISHRTPMLGRARYGWAAIRSRIVKSLRKEPSTTVVPSSENSLSPELRTHIRIRRRHGDQARCQSRAALRHYWSPQCILPC